MSFKHLEKALLNRRSYDIGGYHEIYNESLIQRARNNIAKKFLEDTQDDFLLFLDSDIVILTDFAIDMLVEANKDIIAGAYVFKGYPVKPAFRLKGDDYNLTNRADIIEALYVSSGFMLIKRGILREIFNATVSQPFGCFSQVDTGEFLSEDWSFCELSRINYGIKSFIHTKIELAHLGIYPYTMKDFYRFYNDKEGLKGLDFNIGIKK